MINEHSMLKKNINSSLQRKVGGPSFLTAKKETGLFYKKFVRKDVRLFCQKLVRKSWPSGMTALLYALSFNKCFLLLLFSLRRHG